MNKEVLRIYKLPMENGWYRWLALFSNKTFISWQTVFPEKDYISYILNNNISNRIRSPIGNEEYIQNRPCLSWQCWNGKYDEFCVWRVENRNANTF